MRLWSLHPQYLDSKGLVALWREALLAQAVLAGKTRGYKNHPQLDRFKASRSPLKAISFYLTHVYQEAVRRGYEFDETKIIENPNSVSTMKVTRGQLKFELQHLRAKITERDAEHLGNWGVVKEVMPHPLFKGVAGEIEPWEKR